MVLQSLHMLYYYNHDYFERSVTIITITIKEMAIQHFDVTFTITSTHMMVKVCMFDIVYWK